MGVALILMVGVMGVAAIVLLAAIAIDVRRGVGIWTRILDGDQTPLPAAPPRKPWDREAVIASAKRVYDAAQRARLAEEGDGSGTTGRRQGQDPVQLGLDHAAREAWMPCSPDGSRLDLDEDPTLVSASHESGYHIPVDGDGRPVVSPMAASVDVGVFRRVPPMPALGEDEEETRAWERQSGTWEKAER